MNDRQENKDLKSTRSVIILDGIMRGTVVEEQMPNNKKKVSAQVVLRVNLPVRTAASARARAVVMPLSMSQAKSSPETRHKKTRTAVSHCLCTCVLPHVSHDRLTSGN